MIRKYQHSGVKQSSLEEGFSMGNLNDKVHLKYPFGMKWLIILLGVYAMVFGGEPPYIPPNHPMLQENAGRVPLEEIQSDRIQEIIDDMLRLTVDERAQSKMVGLAAPQIGIPLQIICVDTHMTIERIDFSPPLDVFIVPNLGEKPRACSATLQHV